MTKVAIKSLVLGALLIVLLECYYVVTTPGTTIYAASVDVLLSIAVMLIVALFFISELKGVQAEAEAGAKELAASEEKYRRLLGDINDGYVVIQDERIVIANQTFADALGVSIDQIVGTSLDRGSASESPALRFVLEKYRKRVKGELPLAERFEVSSGAGRTFEVSSKLIDYEGRLAVSAVVRDITERKRVEQALRQREEEFRRLLGDINDGYFVIQDEEVVIANQRAADVLGVPIDQIVGTRLGDQIAGSSLYEGPASESPASPSTLERYRKRIKGELPPVERYEVSAGAGRTYEYSVKLIDYEGRPAVSAVVRDITRRKRIEEALRESEEKLRATFESMADGVAVTDLNGVIIDVNESALRVSGFGSKSDLIGKSAFETIAAHDQERALDNMKELLEKGGVRASEHTLVKADGSEYPGEIRASVLKDAHDSPTGFVSVIRDVTERKQMEETIRHMAYHDALTRLPNRRLFDDRLEVELAHAHRNQEELGVLFLDLDRFKEINDTLGHKMGDLLLRAVGERLTSLLRKSDTVARMGGDEFALILPEMAQAEDADKVAQKILESLREPFGLDGTEVRTTVSIGIAVYPDHEKDADTLLSNADTAMYCAKEQGGDRYLRYTPAMGAGSLGETTTIAPELLPVSGDTQDEG